ncbi:MAG: flagellar biosynthesis protein FlhB [Bacillota bacterium]
MSLFGQGQDKTEPATPKRIQKARETGSIAKSQELAGATVFLCLVLLCYLLKDWFYYSMAGFWVNYLTNFTRWELTPANAAALFTSAGLTCLRLLAPAFLVAFVASVAVNIVQVGFIFSPQVLLPKLERVSFTSGLGRMLSAKAAVEFVKASLKVCAIGGLIFWLIKKDLGSLLMLLNAQPAKGFIIVNDFIFRIALTAGIAYFALAVMDYIYRRYSHQKEMMMTKAEVKEEFRQTEGDPMVKGWLRRRQRQAMLNRIKQQVPKATVVVTNPTHVAVALLYEEGMNAPLVIAKGAGYLAARIREIATEHRVPMVENPDVARYLYRRVEVGEEIPSVLYQAVAEIIALVYRLKKNRTG